MCFCTFLACVARIDLGFLIESSQGITRRNFIKIKKFLEALASSFVINPKAVRIGAILYSKGDKVLFAFNNYRKINSYKSIRGVTRAIRKMPYLGSKGANINVGLKRLHQFLFASFHKKSVKRVAIVVTANKSSKRIGKFAYILKKSARVEIIVVQIGKNFKRTQLRKMASSKGHIFYVPTFKNLGRRLVKLVQRKACKGAPKPSSRFIVFNFA